MIDKVKIKAIIKQYADKGERLLEEAYENGDHASTTGYWDGYRDCANLLLRELDDIQEESKVCMYSTANYTNADRLTLCKDCEELCKYNQKTAAESLGISQEVYDEIVDKCLYGSEVELVNNGDLPKEEPVSEDLEQAIDNYLATYFGGEKEKQDWPFLKKMAIHFANWQKEQLLATAVDAVVKVDAGGYPYIPQMELYDYENDIPLAKEGDKYNVILIKED